MEVKEMLKKYQAYLDLDRDELGIDEVVGVTG